MSVVDASVWVAAAVATDANHTAAAYWLRRHLGSDEQTRLPTLALAEVAGAIKRRTSSTPRASMVLRQLRRTPRLELAPLDLARAEDAAQLAHTFGLRGADSVYGALALAAGDELVTFDREMATRLGGLLTVVVPSS